MPRRSEAYLLEKRLEILTAARRVAQRKGFASTSLRDIAAEVGMSMGSIANHFARKHDIVLFAADRARAARAEALRAVADGADPPARLTSWLADLLTSSGFAEAAVLELDLVAEAHRSADVAAAVRGAAHDTLAALRALGGGGDAVDADDADDRGKLVLALVYGLAVLEVLDLAPGEDAVRITLRSLIDPGGTP